MASAHLGVCALLNPRTLMLLQSPQYMCRTTLELLASMLQHVVPTAANTLVCALLHYVSRLT